MNIAERLCSNLKKYREAAHLTGSELSRRSGVSRSYLWQIEQGESVPTIEVIEQIATGLGLSIETLLGLDGFNERQYEMQVRKRVLEKIQEEIRIELEQLSS